MTPTLLDRLIAYVAPVHGAKRLAARGAFEAFSGGGADGASMSPLNGRWAAVARSPDADIVRGLPRQRAESRDLRRHNPIAGGAISTNIHRVVGTGLVPVPEPDVAVLGWTAQQADDFKAAVTREFSLWADSAESDYYGGQNFYQWQELVLGSRLESGDCFTLLPDGRATSTQPYLLRRQLIEADRVGNPGGAADTDAVVMGVRRGATGAPQACHVYKRHPGSSTTTTGSKYAGDWVDYIGPSGRRRILHHYRPNRPEQTRGVPYLAPVIQAIKDLGRYTEAEITAAVISAFYTVFIKQADRVGPPPIHGLETGQDAEGAPGPGFAMGAGAIIGLAPGESVEIADPKRPNTAYEPFVTGILTLIGMGLNLPRELLMKKFDSSFSASKAALLDAWFHFKSERHWLVLSACQPVYETLLAEAVATGRIAAPGFFESALLRWAYTRASWHGDSQGSINPKDEVAAYTAAVDARLMTREKAEWELFGSDWHRTYPAKLREHQMLTRDGMQPTPKAGAAAPAVAPAAAQHDAPATEALDPH